MRVVVCVVAVSLLAVAHAVPLTQALSSADIGITKFEAKLMSLARIGKYELALGLQELHNIVVAAHPFHKYEEDRENVVLLDEFPYVPVVEVPTFNSTFVLSSLVLREAFDPRYLKVELNMGYQSLKFLDMSLNATFNWRINNTEQHGRAIVHVPHAWIHQNVEMGCSRDMASILSWEGRVDLYVDGVEIATSVDNKLLMDAFAEELHKSTILKKYLGNALQHQLASFLGDIHWKLQARMRDLCLACVVVKNNNQTMVAQLRGDKACINSVPSFFWNGVYDENDTPQSVQGVVGDALREAMVQQFRKKSGDEDLLETQDLSAVDVKLEPLHFDKLVPRNDPRDRYRKKSHPGFVDETVPVSGWKQKIGQLWMRFRYGGENTNTTQSP